MQCQCVEVDRVAFERASGILLLSVCFRLAFVFGAWCVLLNFADAVGNEIHHVESGDALFLQIVDRVRVFFAEDRHQDIRPVDFLLAGGLDVQDGALDNALESQRRLRIDFFLALDTRRVLTDKFVQIAAELCDIAAASAQGICCRWVVEQSQKQVFHGDELVALLSSFDKSHVQADFQFLRNHSVFLHDTGERMLAFAGVGCHLFNFGGGHVA